MIRVLTCITEEHDLRLVAVAVVVCILASCSAFPLLRRADHVHADLRSIWLALAAIAIGVGAWATHFIAELAFLPEETIGYGFTLTLMSVFLVLAITAFGLWVRGRAKSWLRRATAGAIIGLGIGIMHYVGMQAVFLGGWIEYDATYVAASILGGTVLAALAFGLEAKGPLVAGNLLALSIAVLHFTGMAGVTIIPDAAISIPDETLNRGWLAVLIAISVAACLMVSLVAVALDSRAAQREMGFRLATESKMRYLAHHDALTGLGNRVLLREQLTTSLQEARERQEELALLYIDLDRFKMVNDLHGHSAGDRLLQETAHRLRTELRKSDFIARLGGDEFAVLQMGAEQPKGAEQLASRLLQTLTRPYDLGGPEALISASIGIAIFPRDARDGESLLANADTALYRAKQSGRNTFALFHRDMDQEIRERQILTNDIRQALQRGELFLVYQPLAETKQGIVTGFEALLRWRHPTRGLIMPDVFIPLAESSGAIVQIGEWVLREACREAARWAKPLRVSVNVSAMQVQHGRLPETVRTALKDSGLSPDRLEIEVTESVVIQDLTHAVRTLNEIKTLGVTLAIDDFGTGYSSLSTLRAFPFDRIKVDRGFVHDLPRNGDAATIIRAVLGLGRGLSVPVVAEGVETTAQLQLLRNEGCEEIQGYLIGRPEPIESFAHLTRRDEEPEPQLPFAPLPAPS